MPGKNAGQVASPRVQYARFLRELRALIETGRRDGEEADLVREAMDAQWLAMTDEERALMDGLASDLRAHAVHCGRSDSSPLVSAAPISGRDIDTRWTGKLWAAIRQKQETWGATTALQLLRAVPADAKYADVQFLRAVCWFYLGDGSTADHFANLAHISDTVNYPSPRMEELLGAPDRVTVAVRRLTEGTSNVPESVARSIKRKLNRHLIFFGIAAAITSIAIGWTLIWSTDVKDHDRWSAGIGLVLAIGAFGFVVGAFLVLAQSRKDLRKLISMYLEP